MKDHLHIRNAEAAHLARARARQTGKKISEVVLEALRQYRPVRRPRPVRRSVEHWRKLLREDREAGFLEPELPIESLYHARTGLPK